MSSYGAETFSTANAVNDLGLIVGAKYTYSSQEVIPRATRWFRDLFVFDLGTLPGGTLSEALGVNNLGQVVGYSTTRDGSTHAFLWQRGVMQDLGTLGPEYGFSRANGINDRGEIVGVSCRQGSYRMLTDPRPINDPSCRAFHWQNGVMSNLGVYPGGTFSSAQAINNRGQVAGSGDILATDYPYGSAYEVRALVWNKGIPAVIPPARGPSLALCLCATYGTGIDDHGGVIGFLESSFLGNWAFYWIAGNQTPIGRLGGRALMVTVATGVNNRGQIVGVSPFSAAGYDELEIAFLFEKSNSVPLPTLNPQLPGSPEYTGAQAINASGLIVGWDSGKAVMWERGTVKPLP